MAANQSARSWRHLPSINLKICCDKMRAHPNLDFRQREEACSDRH